jgi:hypothetical protein
MVTNFFQPSSLPMYLPACHQMAFVPFRFPGANLQRLLGFTVLPAVLRKLFVRNIASILCERGRAYFASKSRPIFGSDIPKQNHPNFNPLCGFCALSVVGFNPRLKKWVGIVPSTGRMRLNIRKDAGIRKDDRAFIHPYSGTIIECNSEGVSRQVQPSNKGDFYPQPRERTL